MSVYPHLEVTSKPHSKDKGYQVNFDVVLDTSIHSTPFLIVYENSFYETPFQADRQEIFPVSKKGNSYLFTLSDEKRPMYFSLAYREGQHVIFILDSYHYEPGDNIKLAVKKAKAPRLFFATFTGKNAGKYRCQYDLASSKKVLNYGISKDLNSTHNNFDEVKILMKAQQDIIDKYKADISAYSFNLFKLDSKSKLFYQLLSKWNAYFSQAKINKDSILLNKLVSEYSNFQDIFETTNVGVDSILFDSRYYSKFLQCTIDIEYLIADRKLDYYSLFNTIKKIPSRSLRDKLIVSYFYRNSTDISANFPDLLRHAISKVENKQSLEKLHEFTRISKGKEAFDFELQDVNGKLIKLSQFKNKVVFIDFWFTGCGACKSYYKDVLCEVEQIYENNKDVVFVTICIDQDKQKWINSINEGKYTSKKVVNLYTNGEGSNHPLIRFYNIIGYPQPLIIDQKGYIAKFKGRELRSKDRLIEEIEKTRKLYLR